jgi:hypothetical protein
MFVILKNLKERKKWCAQMYSNTNILVFYQIYLNIVESGVKHHDPSIL